MIREVVQTSDAVMAANVGGPVQNRLRTFDVDLPELEAFLREDLGVYADRQVIGVELPASADDNGDGKHG